VFDKKRTYPAGPAPTIKLCCPLVITMCSCSSYIHIRPGLLRVESGHRCMTSVLSTGIVSCC